MDNKNKVNCHTKNVVYMIECNKSRCKENDIGETHKPLYSRICEYCGKKIYNTTGNNFNKPGRSMENVIVTILEKVFKLEGAREKPH